MLADRPGTANPSLKVYSHAISTSPVVWCAPPALVAAAKRDFPHSLARVPLQLSTTHAMLRSRLEPWLDCEGVRPNVVGDFEDSSLLKTFGASGMGVFPAVEAVHDDLVERYGVKRIGRSEGVKEHFYAIGTEKKVLHPLVQRLL